MSGHLTIQRHDDGGHGAGDEAFGSGAMGHRMQLKREVLARHPLFAFLTDVELARLAHYARLQVFPGNSLIFSKGDKGASLLAVVSGRVKICSQSPDGKEVMLNVIQPGELFGEISLLDGRPRTADAVTMQESEILILERRDFVPFVRQNPDVAISLMEVLCGRIRRTSEQAENVLLRDMRINLAQVILRLATPKRNSHIAVVDVTQKELGQMTGLSRESTNKQIQEWVRRGWVETYKGGLYVHNIAALQQYAENT